MADPVRSRGGPDATPRTAGFACGALVVEVEAPPPTGDVLLVNYCRDAWASAHPDEDGGTFVRENPIVADWDWPSRRIDYILVRCLEHGGPSLAIDSCRRLHDQPIDGVWASDHFGLTADLVLPPKLGAGA